MTGQNCVTLPSLALWAEKLSNLTWAHWCPKLNQGSDRKNWEFILCWQLELPAAAAGVCVKEKCIQKPQNNWYRHEDRIDYLLVMCSINYLAHCII